MQRKIGVTMFTVSALIATYGVYLIVRETSALLRLHGLGFLVYCGLAALLGMALALDPDT